MAFIPGRGLKDVIAHLDDAQRALAGANGAGLEMDDTALQKLRWLEADDRDFRKVTPALTKRMEKVFVAKLDKVLLGRAKPSDPATAAVTEYRDVVVERIGTSGGDVPVRALRPSTVEKKGHARVGDDTGDLKRRVKRAKVRATRG